MSWIKQISLSKDLDQANVIRCMSLDPEAAKAVMELATAAGVTAPQHRRRCSRALCSNCADW